MNTYRSSIFIIGLAVTILFGFSTVQAGNADPQTGYNSLYDNILEKGANNGRCNAIGVLGSLICGSTATELVPPINPTITELCEAVGVTIELPYESCYAPIPIDCVVEWSEWSLCAHGTIGPEDPCLRSRTATIVTPPENGGSACPFSPEVEVCECPSNGD